MDDQEKKKLAEEIAVFRHGVIADLVRLRPGTKGLHALIAKRAEEEFKIPGTNRTRVAGRNDA